MKKWTALKKSCPIFLSEESTAFRCVRSGQFCVFFVKVSRDNEESVIGLLVFLVEFFELGDRNFFDIARVADRGPSIAVPLIGRAEHLLVQTLVVSIR